MRGRWSSTSVAKWRRDTRRRRRVQLNPAFTFPGKVSSVPRCLESVAAATDAALRRGSRRGSRGNASRPEGEAPLPLSHPPHRCPIVGGLARFHRFQLRDARPNSSPPPVADACTLRAVKIRRKGAVEKSGPSPKTCGETQTPLTLPSPQRGEGENKKPSPLRERVG